MVTGRCYIYLTSSAANFLSRKDNTGHVQLAVSFRCTSFYQCMHTSNRIISLFIVPQLYTHTKKKSTNTFKGKQLLILLMYNLILEPGSFKRGGRGTVTNKGKNSKLRCTKYEPVIVQNRI